MDIGKEETAEESLRWIFSDITLRQDVPSSLKNALAGDGFRTTDQDANIGVYFYSQFTPRPLPEDSELTYIRDAFLPETVVIAANSYISQGLTGEEEFTYAYPCDEFCDKFQEYLDQNYYPDHRQMRDIVDPLLDQLRAAMPDPGLLPEAATLDDKATFMLTRWIRMISQYWLYRVRYNARFPGTMAAYARGESPQTNSDVTPSFPWTADDPIHNMRHSEPGTVRLIAHAQASRLMREGQHFETVISREKFYTMVQEWLEVNWYPDHTDERADVENSLTQLRHALTTP